MEAKVFLNINGDSVQVDTTGKKLLGEVVDDAFRQTKHYLTHDLKSIHIGHLGTKAISANVPIDGIDQSKQIHLMLVPKAWISVEDAEGCLESLTITSQEMSRHLSQHIVTFSDTFHYVDKPIKALKVLSHISNLRIHVTNLDSKYYGFATRMIQYYEKEKERTEIGDRIRFAHLGFHFITDSKVIIRQRETDMGGIVMESSYQTSFFGATSWTVKVGYTQYSEDKFIKKVTYLTIDEYEGLLPFSELSISDMSPDDEIRLTERGEQFIQLCKNGSTHLYYKGISFFKSGWWTMDKSWVQGRVIVDVVGFNENNPQYQIFRDENSHPTSFCVPFTCWPTLPAFCLSTMKWGEVHVDGLSEIQFNENAFDRLVIDDDQKQLIHAIVENPFEYADLVEGKSMGTILLLHGPPGVGKTSTAEATSETLKRPLYKFTSGQLGVTPTELYKNLNTNLKLAQRWNAVALIDEVDIYLEKRADNDIVRNAMVGIFLNLLEYYQGTLFLTTNRVKCFDDAFQSRISVALYFNKFSQERRCQVWQKHLEYAKLTHLYSDELGTFHLNGRQIGTCIRIAMSLAKSEKCEPTFGHLKRVILLNEKWSFKNVGEAPHF